MTRRAPRQNPGDQSISDDPRTPDDKTSKHDLQPEGVLELTWRGKGITLLSHDEGRSYSWVSPDDYRVKEVRLLRDVPILGKIGETHFDSERCKDNLLIRGDARHALNSLLRLPEFAAEYRGKAKLVYIDPPYNTGAAFGYFGDDGTWVEQYDDALEHSVWLTMMRDRLLQARELLASDGSIWVQLDDKEVHYCKILMDEIFGRDNFLANIVWQKSYSPKNDSKAPSGDHDTILVYARDRRSWKMNGLPRTEKNNASYKNPDNDPRGPWMSDNYSAKSGGPSMRYTIIGPMGQLAEPPVGRYWGFSELSHRENERENRVWWGKDGKNAVPRYKRFLSEVGGTTPSSFWTHEEVGHNQDAKREIMNLFPGESPFSTPKPEFLMQRIIHIATNQGDLIFDFFAGSGSTLAVAQKMGRRWVGVEWSADTLVRFTEPRLRKVVTGEDPGGVTEVTNWAGGGGFRVLDVGPSMYELDEYGDVQLAGWVAGDALAEAVAAQARVGFTYERDGIFAGVKGSQRLVVVDGLVTEHLVDVIVSALPKGQKARIAGTAASDEVMAYAKSTKRVAKVEVIPASLVAAHERSSALREAMNAQRELERQALETATVALAAQARTALVSPSNDGIESLFADESESK